MMEAVTEKAEEIFYSALEIKSPDERKAFLDRACLENAVLRAAVEDMLASQAKVDKFFSEGGSQSFSISELAGSLAEKPDPSGKEDATPLVDEKLG